MFAWMFERADKSIAFTPYHFVAITIFLNRPFAQLLPGLETGHPVTVGQSPTCSFSVSDGREVLFLSPFRAVLGAIHVQVTDRPSPDAPSLTQANNCANGLL